MVIYLFAEVMFLYIVLIDSTNYSNFLASKMYS